MFKMARTLLVSVIKMSSVMAHCVSRCVIRTILSVIQKFMYDFAHETSLRSCVYAYIYTYIHVYIHTYLLDSPLVIHMLACVLRQVCKHKHFLDCMYIHIDIFAIHMNYKKLDNVYASI